MDIYQRMLMAEDTKNFNLQILKTIQQYEHVSVFIKNNRRVVQSENSPIISQYGFEYQQLADTNVVIYRYQDKINWIQAIEQQQLTFLVLESKYDVQHINIELFTVFDVILIEVQILAFFYKTINKDIVLKKIINSDKDSIFNIRYRNIRYILSLMPNLQQSKNIKKIVENINNLKTQIQAFDLNYIQKLLTKFPRTKKFVHLIDMSKMQRIISQQDQIIVQNWACSMLQLSPYLGRYNINQISTIFVKLDQLLRQFNAQELVQDISESQVFLNEKICWKGIIFQRVFVQKQDFQLLQVIGKVQWVINNPANDDELKRLDKLTQHLLEFASVVC